MENLPTTITKNINNLQTAAKYSGASLVLAGAVTNVLVYLFPGLLGIEISIITILGFIVNLLLVLLFKWGVDLDEGK